MSKEGITVTLDPAMIEYLDALAHRKRSNRSQLIESALIQYLGSQLADSDTDDFFFIASSIESQRKKLKLEKL